MISLIKFILPVLVLTVSCADHDRDYYTKPQGLSEVPPSDIDNLCQIFKDKPHWKSNVMTVADHYGVPPSVVMAIMRHESGFNQYAKNPNSSAFGYAQALDGTWEDFQDDTDNDDASRTRFSDAVAFIAWYINKNKNVGINPLDAYNNYLAYHEGRTGYLRGGYHQKNWLLNVAQNVNVTAHRFYEQVHRC